MSRRIIGVIAVSLFLLASVFLLDFFDALHPAYNQKQQVLSVGVVSDTDVTPENGYTIASITTVTPTAMVITSGKIGIASVPTTISPTVTPTVKVTTTPKPTVKPTTKPTATPTKTPTPTGTPTVDYSKPWTVAPGCPTTTQNCVPCTSGSDCRFEPGKTHGFRGWACQNNNPGNIRGDYSLRNQIIVNNGGQAACGVRYDIRTGSYYVFSTYTAGMNALIAYIKGINNGQHPSYPTCGNCSISDFFKLYANDPNYASFVAGYIGESTSQTLRNVVNSGKLNKFAEAIKIHEGFITQ